MEMSVDFKRTVLVNLYRNMEGSFGDGCHGMNYSNYDDKIRASLKEAEGLELTWGDFYEVHEQFVNIGKEKYISELRGEEEMKIRLAREENGEKIYLVSSDGRVELNPGITLADLCDSIIEKDVAGVEAERIVKKFPEDKKINPDDFSLAQGYFRENLRY